MGRSRQRLCRAALILLAVIEGVWLVRLDYRRKISTDILDLIPKDEASAETALVRSLAADVHGRVMLFALTDGRSPGTAPQAAAERLARELRSSPLFSEVVPLQGSAAETAMGRAIFDRRYRLLLPAWLGDEERRFAAARPAAPFSPWLAERAAAALEDFTARPDAMALEKLIPLDPLLLTPHLIERVRGAPLPGSAARGHALVWALISPSPFREEGQAPVFAAIERAEARVRAAYPGVELRWSGVNRFAAASRAQIEREIRTLNLLSLLAVFAVGCAFVRRPWKVFHLLPVVVLSLMGAWTISTLIFERLHLLVFVIGALLSGVAIDYGFYIYMQAPAEPGEPYGRKLGRLIKPLLASCLTTVTGFLMLLFSGLPLIREVGVFVSAGLLCALASAMLYFGQIESPYLQPRRFGLQALGRDGGGRIRRWPLAIFAAAAAVALAGPWRLHWRDDVRELEIPAPALDANQDALERLFGGGGDRGVYVTYGVTLAEARERLQRFLDFEADGPARAGGLSLAPLFPTEEDWRQFPARLQALRGFGADFRAALGRHGFDPDSFAGFFRDWGELEAHPPSENYAALYAEAARSLSGPLELLGHAGGPLAWFVTLMPPGALPAPPAEMHTVNVDQLRTLDHLFARYRWSALRLSLVGLGLVIASVFAIYPFRRGIRIALIPAGSCFVVFGLFGLLGETLNLFNLLGAFLGVCLAHNYAIFSSDTSWAGVPPPVSIRLSALCAAASFGVLSLSRIPVVHGLGMTVAAIVLTALAFVELETILRIRPREP